MSSASTVACIGPAPPNAMSEKSAGSWPRSMVTSRMALAIWATATRTMPSAIRTTPPTPSRFDRPSTAFRARVGSGSMAPPSRRVPMRPSTMLASVIVGSVPPRP